MNEYTCLHERTNINDGFYHKWPPFYENNWTGTDNDGSNTKLSYRLSQQVGQNILEYSILLYLWNKEKYPAKPCTDFWKEEGKKFYL